MQKYHCPVCNKKCFQSIEEKIVLLNGEKIPRKVKIMKISCHKCGYRNESIKT